MVVRMGVATSNGARPACNTTPRRWQASSCRPTQPSYATSMDRDGERNSLCPRNSQASYPKKLSSACLLTKTSLRKHHFITVQKRAPSHPLHVPAPEHRCVGCTNCPHQPFFRSQPYRRADRVRDLHACDRRSNPLLRAMTAIVLKITPNPHYGDEEMRAGAA